MTRLIFVRHGESAANTLGVFSNRSLAHPLTGRGRDQAAQLAHRLCQESVDRIYTSPLPRASETAEILHEQLGAPVQLAPALREYDVGRYDGSSDAEHWREYDDVLTAWMLRDDWDRRVGGGESYREMERRFQPFVEQILGQAGTTVLVGHGGIYRCMLPRTLANVTPRWALAHPLDNTEVVLAIPHNGRVACTRWGDTTTEPGDVLDVP